jgi:hypothetical protein
MADLKIISAILTSALMPPTPLPKPATKVERVGSVACGGIEFIEQWLVFSTTQKVQ